MGILPRRSEAELEEVPPDLRQETEFVRVDTAEDVLDDVLESPPARARSVAASSRVERGPGPPGTSE